jgi:hypothetical protein
MHPTLPSDGTSMPVGSSSGPMAPEALAPRRAEQTEDLPPVFQFPVVGTVRATGYDAGRLDPLPFPEQDGG